MNLSLPIVCKIHKKPVEFIGISGYKKIRKNCCDITHGLDDVECKIIYGVIHI